MIYCYGIFAHTTESVAIYPDLFSDLQHSVFPLIYSPGPLHVSPCIELFLSCYSNSPRTLLVDFGV